MLQATTLISRLAQVAIALVETWLFGNLRHAQASPALGTLGDLTRSRAELIAENALLRHQLGILRRQIKRPQLTKRDQVVIGQGDCVPGAERTPSQLQVSGLKAARMTRVASTAFNLIPIPCNFPPLLIKRWRLF